MNLHLRGSQSAALSPLLVRLGDQPARGRASRDRDPHFSQIRSRRHMIDAFVVVLGRHVPRVPSVSRAHRIARVINATTLARCGLRKSLITPVDSRQ